MNRAEVVDIADALRRFPGVRHATARDRDAESAAAHSVWVVSFAVSADDLGREAAELIRMAVQESSRVQLREATASAGLVRYALRGLAESRPAELATALQRAGRRLFEYLRNY